MDKDKNTELFLHQKETLDMFLSTGAITKAQYNKSYGDLVVKMGMEEVAKGLAAADGDRQKTSERTCI